MVILGKRQNVSKNDRAPKKIIGNNKNVPARSKGSLKNLSAAQKLPKRNSISGSTENNIEVILRCKGKHSLKSFLTNTTRPSIITPEIGREETDVCLNAKNTVYKFDRVFYQECSQKNLYDRVGKPIVQQVLNGYNCTIFAYGQTGTGKTYTMEGDLENSNEKAAPNAGIIPRIICDLFQNLNSKEDTVKISMLELYNEELRDLLRLDESTKPLNIFEDITSGVKVQNVHEVMIANASQGLDIMKSGVKKRMTAATKCNENSSRSHCIFTITITFQKKNDNGAVNFCTSKLNLVDLAGSENSKASGSEHLRAKEASSINKSLLTLGRVIKLLAEKALHIPYRESKLTRLLKDSLGGRTKTAIITTIDPLVQNVEEIKNALEYSSHAKSISNIPQKNTMALYEKRMDVLIDDYFKLQEELHRSWDKNGHCLSNDEYDEWLSKFEITQQKLVEKYEENVGMREELAKMREEKTTMKEETKRKDEIIEQLRGNTKKKDEEVSIAQKEISLMRKEIAEMLVKAKEKEKEKEKTENKCKKIEQNFLVLQKENTSQKREIHSMKADFSYISEYATNRGLKRERDMDGTMEQSCKK